VVRYSFLVGLFHSLLHAGFYPGALTRPVAARHYAFRPAPRWAEAPLLCDLHGGGGNANVRVLDPFGK
jgi:hypothetical protein